MERIRSFITFIKDESWGFIDGRKLGLERIYFKKSSFLDENFSIKKGDTIEFTLEKNSYGYEAFNITNIDRLNSKYNTEDKYKWTEEGYKLEQRFIREIAPLFGKKNLIEHPMKEQYNWYIDLFDKDTNGIADLKCQQTPFFTCNRIDNRFDPQFTVTFNKNDYEKYIENYKSFTNSNLFDIYWWVDWKVLQYGHISITPLSGVWVVPFSEIANAIENNKVPLHEYQNRKGDRINAKDSYLFDIRWFTQLL